MIFNPHDSKHDVVCKPEDMSELVVTYERKAEHVPVKRTRRLRVSRWKKPNRA